MSETGEPPDGRELDGPRDPGLPDSGARREPPGHELMPAVPGTSQDGRAETGRQNESDDYGTRDSRAEERLRRERDRARASYSVHSMGIDADRAAGRDYHEWRFTYEQHFHSTAWTTAGAGAVSPSDLDDLRAVYSATDADSELRKRLDARRLVVLYGRRDSGRHATALIALDEVTGRDRASSRVAILPSPDSLKDLPDDELKEGRGHLIDMSGRPERERDQEATIGRLRKRLDDVKAYLIVLSDDLSDGPSPSRTLLGETQEHQPPDPRDVIRAQLPAFVSGPAPIDATRLLAEAEDHGEVADWLRVMRAPEEAVALAAVIGEWAGVRESEPEAVPDAQASRYAYLRRHARRLLRDIERDDTPLHQAFALAAGVLDGTPMAQITEVAEDLADRLRAVERPGAEASGRPVFTDPLAARLTYAEVRGSKRGPIVELYDPALAGVLLDVVWNEYDAARRSVLDWLKALCASRHQVRQARGALAIARLASVDFALIEREVLIPWSRQNGRQLLQCAAWILEALYDAGAHRRRVYRLLMEWARGGRRQQRAIAVRALGTRIGRARPEDALRAIADAGQNDVKRGRSYARYVENALVELYELDRREHVLRALHEWRDRPVLDDRAAVTFVRLCRKTTPEKTPELLDAMAAIRPPLSMTQFGDLWRHALASPVSSERAWYWLREWLDHAYHHLDVIRHTFDLLQLEITKDPVLRARLDRHRRFWRLQDEARAGRPMPAEPDDPADDDDLDDFDDLDDVDDLDGPAGDERRPLILEDTNHE